MPSSTAPPLEFPAAGTVCYRGRSSPASAAVYSTLVSLAAAGGRLRVWELAPALGWDEAAVARACRKTNRVLKRLGHPGRVAAGDGDVVLSVRG